MCIELHLELQAGQEVQHTVSSHDRELGIQCISASSSKVFRVSDPEYWMRIASWTESTMLSRHQTTSLNASGIHYSLESMTVVSSGMRRVSFTPAMSMVMPSSKK